MRALLLVAALVVLSARESQAFFGYGDYREARRNYHEVMNRCDSEGGECIDVDFNAPPAQTDPPPQTDPPQQTDPPNFPPFFQPLPPTPAPPVHIFIPVFWPPTRAPPATTRAPITTTTRAPPVTTLAPLVTTKAPVKTTAKPPGKNRKGRKQRRRMNPEQEVELRKRRAVPPGLEPFEYLYNECGGGWEFDLGCGVRGNVCCYPYSSNNY